ncbi:MAG: hypothetical protein IJ099_07470 [Alphaproteobacteria bacterium]|nr:hypothetical protein [Alphaproteobacteria bacterium]
MIKFLNADLQKAYSIAEHADVATPPDSLLLYSISYLPTDENKKQAFAYKKEHPQSFMLDDTECGKKLLALNLDTANQNQNPPEELMKIWAVASRRFIMAASGNVTAFVENADVRSTFVSVELPLILQNDHIQYINGIAKHKFAQQWPSILAKLDNKLLTY